MNLSYTSLENCHKATDTVVVIDVCRAFTTAAYAFAAGASEIMLVSSVDEAFRLRDQTDGALVMGEVDGVEVDGFDFGNSPNEFIGVNLNGRRLIQRTSAGTQGVVRSTGARTLLTGSFVCAGASARHIKRFRPNTVTFVVSGIRSNDAADEDRACADYLAALLSSEKPDAEPYLYRARAWLKQYAGEHVEPVRRAQLIRDFDRCVELDRFDFAMRVQRRGGLLAMTPVTPS